MVLFMHVRKCSAASSMTANPTGSWMLAPYLDRHGEADPTLRRHLPLFLKQKRYDELLRILWLQHGIPSAIARRLEGEVNNGGWETL